MSPVNFLTMATRLSLFAESLVLFATSLSKTSFLFTAAAARLSKYPYRAFMKPSSTSCLFSTFSVVSWWAVESAAPNFTVPSLACALIRALAWAFL